MADREKLIELINKSMNECPPNVGSCRNCPYFIGSGDDWCDTYAAIADHLIANGVTIQRWIPVTERLPEIEEGWMESRPVLWMMKSTQMIYAGYYGENGTYRDKYFRTYSSAYEGVDADDVLCWMWQNDLPEAPKGE